MSGVSLVLHAVTGWAMCGATFGIGRAFLTISTTPAVHALVAPTAFGVLTSHYFSRHSEPSPTRVAVTFLAIVIGLDGLVVAPLVERSWAMFRSAPGTWIPFALIGASTYAVGRRQRAGQIKV